MYFVDGLDVLHGHGLQRTESFDMYFVDGLDVLHGHGLQHTERNRRLFISLENSPPAAISPLQT